MEGKKLQQNMTGWEYNYKLSLPKQFRNLASTAEDRKICKN